MSKDFCMTQSEITVYGADFRPATLTLPWHHPAGGNRLTERVPAAWSLNEEMSHCLKKCWS